MPSDRFYAEMFKHFGSKLYERYNILVTFEEYLKLCKSNIIIIAEEKSKAGGDCKLIGFLTINNVTVLVVKKKTSSKHLITALPITNALKYVK